MYLSGARLFRLNNVGMGLSLEWMERQKQTDWGIPVSLGGLGDGIKEGGCSDANGFLVVTGGSSLVGSNGLTSVGIAGSSLVGSNGISVGIAGGLRGSDGFLGGVCGGSLG